MPAINTPFPHAERRTLRSPPIELIIAQVRFPTLADFFRNDAFVAFAGAFRESYPHASPVDQIEVGFGPRIISESPLVPAWQFQDLNRLWTVTLTPDFLALETRQYQSFSTFRDKFVSAWEYLIRAHSIKNRTRLGLRYLDRFAKDRHPALPTGWINLVEKSIFPLRQRDPTMPQTGQSAHSFVISEELRLTFRSSFKSGGLSDPTQDEFILDLDCFDQKVAGTGDAASRMDDLKEVTHNAFWWTFGDLLDTLEPPDGTV